MANEADIKELAEKLEQNCIEICKKNSGKCPHNSEGEIPCYLCYAEYLFSEGYRNIKNITLTLKKPPLCEKCKLVECIRIDCVAHAALLNRKAQLAHNLKEIEK